MENDDENDANDNGDSDSDDASNGDVDDDEERADVVAREQQEALWEEERLQLISILEKKRNFPHRVRKRLNGLIHDCIEETKESVIEALCGNDAGQYRALDDQRCDTEAEIRTAVGFFPEVLSTRKDQKFDYETGEWVDAEGQGDYPIHCAAKLEGNVVPSCNVVSVSFVGILAQLGIEYNQFPENERGGLLVADENGYNPLQLLVKTSNFKDRSIHHRWVDNSYLSSMINLRRIGLFQKKDICNYGLLNILLKSEDHFARKRCQFLVEWDPTLLVRPGVDGLLPLHCVAQSPATADMFLVMFSYIFKCGLKYYPKTNGINLVFRKNEDGKTPFELSYDNIGRSTKNENDDTNGGDDDDDDSSISSSSSENDSRDSSEYDFEKISDLREFLVMKIIEGILKRCQKKKKNRGPYDIIYALLTAVTDENITVDCVFFLLRREPDVLQKLLSSPSATPVPPTIIQSTDNTGILRKRKRSSKDDSSQAINS